ncbi:cell number regulator 1-like [Cryptomeria japonica]|uniref:cell number regulator 1-like n=1 Tax=Cryptomeria japonica TaxID=3369 RepID=UPI0025AC6962|nr:cell number regulator 1-like [Cryptomeria japonica]
MYAPSAPTVEHEESPHPPQNPYAHTTTPQNLYTQPIPQNSPGYPPPEQIATGYPLPPQNPYSHPHQQYPLLPPPPPPPAQNASAQFVNMIYVQPPPQFHLVQGVYDLPALWASDIFACTEDPSNCCLTLWCPCVTFGQIAEIVDEGSTSCVVSGGIHGVLCLTGYALAGVYGPICLTGLGWCYSCMYRTKMRAKYNLAETPCGDCLLHCLCEPCALCQEYKELKYRGYDPALGNIAFL